MMVIRTSAPLRNDEYYPQITKAYAHMILQARCDGDKSKDVFILEHHHGNLVYESYRLDTTHYRKKEN